ncbi:hypothetical protein HKD37_15G043737 [Glycine soja]
MIKLASASGLNAIESLYFFLQDTSESDPFVLGIQTEWQLQQMIRYGHRNVVAADSTFGAKRLKYPLFTLLVFDSRQHALPVAWVITRSFAKPDVSKWLKALIDQTRSVEPGWKLNGFLIDDAIAEIDLLRNMAFNNEKLSTSKPGNFWIIRSLSC